MDNIHRLDVRRAAMSSPESTPQPKADVQLDEEGRIIINAPELASALKSTSLRRGGGPTNYICPINNVPGCGLM